MLNVLWAFMMLTGILWGAFHGTLDQVTNGALESAGEAVKLGITMLGVMSFWTGILELGRRSGLIEQLSKKMTPLLRLLFPNIPKEHPALQSIAVNMIANVLGLGWAATPAGLKAMGELEELEEERRGREEAEGETGESRAGRGSAAGGEQSRGGREWGKAGKEWGEVRREWGKAGRGGAAEKGKRFRRAVPRGTASNEMCTFLVVNISSLQLIPMTMIAYRAQYGSANPAAVVGPALAATAISTLVGILFCKIMAR